MVRDMDWKDNLTDEERQRLIEIEKARADMNAEYRRIYDRCKKRHRRKLGAVELTTPSGHQFIVDPGDADDIARFRWFSVCHVLKDGKSRTPYIQGNVNGRRVYLHRYLMGEPKGLVIDHIDGDPLNNCRSNLRAVTPSENARGARVDPTILANGFQPSVNRRKTPISGSEVTQ